MFLLVENDEDDFEDDDEDEDDSDETSDDISDNGSLELMPSKARALPSREGDRDEALDVSNVSTGAETLMKLDVPINGRESTI